MRLLINTHPSALPYHPLALSAHILWASARLLCRLTSAPPTQQLVFPQAEKGLAEAPVDLPTVVLLNFRDKLEEDAAAKASERLGTPAAAAAAAAAFPQPRQSASSTQPTGTGKDPSRSGEGDEEGASSSASAAEGGVQAAAGAAAAAAVEGDDGAAQDDGVRPPGTDRQGGGEGGGRGAGAWDHVVTLETARLMMDRVREADLAAGRGGGRRVSLFDCSMKNCFGLRVSERERERVS